MDSPPLWWTRDHPQFFLQKFAFYTVVEYIVHVRRIKSDI